MLILTCWDYNAHLYGNGTVSSCLAKELVSLGQEELILSDYVLMDPFSCTFISQAHSIVSWLDHILTTIAGHERIISVEIDNSFVSFDHLPH